MKIIIKKVRVCFVNTWHILTFFVNIFYKSNEKSLNTDDCFSHFYNVKIKRKKSILNGCAVVFVFEVNEKKYELRNGGEISVRTNQKHLDIQVLQQASFGSDKPFCGHLTASCDGKDVDIVIDIGDGFNRFSAKIITSTNKTVNIKWHNWIIKIRELNHSRIF